CVGGRHSYGYGLDSW
nr:immunoglobulin heavy chain junction region [Macaca mulatta]MOX91775.1 immunoglobulin heavy chain junction region [Macaca mulatta]MOX92023.1 immunoglobulin heavy chain junction region [Macaca mulatta]MOX92146.1 immunoglobulin heavy chain junction region [Macaca mulatta]MOX92346.1 immunoglobulin heavy chain junction region [Macaca mulatta]